MKYIGSPRWRYLALPFAFFLVIPAAVITLVSFGTVRAMSAFVDFVDWGLYDR